MYTDFEFANLRLSDFGLILCRITMNKGVHTVNVGGDITFTTVKNNKTNMHNRTSSTYENVYTTTLEIAKNPCNQNVDNLYMSIDEARNVAKWLQQEDYDEFIPFDEKNAITLVKYFGSFNSISEIMVADKIIGLSLTFTSNSHFGYGNEIDIRTIISEPYERFKIFGDGDNLGMIYPVMTFRCFSDGDLIIKNLVTDNKIEIKNCQKGETIYMDSEYEVIDSDNKNHTRLYNDFNYNYFEIDNSRYDTIENEYEVSLPGEIIITYLPTRKVGVI